MINVEVVVVATEFVKAPFVEEISVWVEEATVCIDIETLAVVCTLLGCWSECFRGNLPAPCLLLLLQFGVVRFLLTLLAALDRLRWLLCRSLSICRFYLGMLLMIGAIR